MGLGQFSEAREAYTVALDQLTDENRLQRRLIEIKLTDLANSSTAGQNGGNR